jgi:hypothetical protein
MTRIEHLAEAIHKKLSITNLSIEVLDDRLPRGFWKDVIEYLPKGMAWGDKQVIANYYGKNKQNILNILKSDFKRVRLDYKPIVSEKDPLPPSEHSEPSLHEELINRDEIIKLINEVMDKRLLDLKESVQIIQNKMETPPESQTIKGSGRGRKERRDYVKITPTMDRVLFNLFDTEAKKKKLSHGKLLDVILWHWYEKPKLSYEED